MPASPEAVAISTENRSFGPTAIAIGTVKTAVKVGASKPTIGGTERTLETGDVAFTTLTTFQRRRALKGPLPVAEIPVVKPGGIRVLAVCAEVDPANAANAKGVLIDLDGAMPEGKYAHLPPITDDLAVLGAVKITNNSTANFVPGTTAFDAAGIVAKYYDLNVAVDYPLP